MTGIPCFDEDSTVLNYPSSDIEYNLRHSSNNSAVVSIVKNAKSWYDEGGHPSRDIATSILSGDARFNFSNVSQTTLLRMNSEAVCVSYDTSTRIESQLNQIASYDAGWMNGEGEKFDRQELRLLAEHFAKHYDFRLMLPTMFASPEQTVSAQWIFDACSVTLDIEPSSLSAEYQAYFHESNDFEETMLNLASPSDWNKLNDLIDRCARR